ncbi:MAG: hypothetical protein LBT97_12230 [Planctomycetota bacterium]|jgi:hypothetical protein|nr:hypothetical protein [Planctomycetota bacterium]
MGIAEEMAKDGWSPASAVDSESPALYRKLTGELTSRRYALGRTLDKGVSPGEFQKGRALLAAYDAALDGLEKARNKRTGVW